MSTRRDPDTSTPESTLAEARERVQRVREQYWQERIQLGYVREETKRKLAAVALTYRDLLVDYRDEEHLQPPWSERGVDWVLEYVDDTVEREVESAGRSGGTRTEEVPAIVAVDHRRLYQLTKRLDKIWRDLGLGADLQADTRPVAEIPYDEEEGETPDRDTGGEEVSADDGD